MKKSLLLLFLFCQYLGFSQDSIAMLSATSVQDSTISELTLSDSLSEDRMGLWEIGDYKIMVDLNPLVSYYQKEYQGLKTSLENLSTLDSLNLSTYLTAMDRYANVVTELEKAQHGYNLRNLVLYIGQDNAQQNLGNSYIIESHVRELVEQGDAAVYFKGNRIFKLQVRYVADFIMSVITIYYETPENYLFNYFGYINW